MRHFDKIQGKERLASAFSDVPSDDDDSMFCPLPRASLVRHTHGFNIQRFPCAQEGGAETFEAILLLFTMFAHRVERAAHHPLLECIQVLHSPYYCLQQRCSCIAFGGTLDALFTEQIHQSKSGEGDKVYEIVILPGDK